MQWLNCWSCGIGALIFFIGAVVGNQVTVWQLGRLADQEGLEIKYKGVKVE